MLFLLRCAFFLCMIHVSFLSASSHVPISAAKFLSPVQCSQVLSKLPKATLSVLELHSRHMSSQAAGMPENIQQRFVRNIYGCAKVVVGGFFSGVAFCIKNIQNVGGFVGKDVQVLALAAVVAAGFWEVNRRLNHHTDLLSVLQESVNGVDNRVAQVQTTLQEQGRVQGEHTLLLNNVETGVGQLQAGQSRLEGGLTGVMHQVENVATNLSEVKETQIKHTDQFASLGSQINGVAEQVGGVQAGVQNMQEVIGEQNLQLKAIQLCTDSLYNRLDFIENSFKKEIAQLREELGMSTESINGNLDQLKIEHARLAAQVEERLEAQMNGTKELKQLIEKNHDEQRRNHAEIVNILSQGVRSSSSSSSSRSRSRSPSPDVRGGDIKINSWYQKQPNSFPKVGFACLSQQGSSSGEKPVLALTYK